jgi:hypothetical protein
VKTRYFPSSCFRVIPIKVRDKLDKIEANERKRLISELVKMNEGFIERGAGREVIRDNGEREYRDVPHFSLKLLKQKSKIHTFVNLPTDKDFIIENKLRHALYKDIGEVRVAEDHLELPEKNLYAFAVRGHYHLAVDLEQQNKMKEVFRLADHMMYSLTVKEVENHEERRYRLKMEMAGITDVKSLVIHETKEMMKTGAKWLYDFWFEEETKQKCETAIQQIKKLLPMKKKPNLPFTQRKLSSDKNRFLIAEVLFLVWTDKEEKAQRFQASLQKLMDEIKGENQLEVVKVEPDLSKVSKGRIQYRLPTLCLYQTELSKFLLLPNIEDPEFYSERPQKTIVPEMMMKPELGGLPFARELYTNRIVYMPRPKNQTDLDDRVKGTIVVGEQGSGKTSYLENQILETYLGGANNEVEWRRYGRSVIAFEVADGALIKNIRQHIPPWAQGNVIILNHADTEHPLHVGFYDVLKVNEKSRSIKKQIADTETKILLDSIGDDSKTVALERYFKAALQASYEVGKGNLIDALNILKQPNYLNLIIDRLAQRGKHNLVNALRENAMDMENDPSVLKTIKNRLVPFMTDDDFMNLIAQEVNPEIDFWKWMNTGPYLVLIYLPGSGQEISLELRKFLFTHYFIKVWLLMLARERIEKEKRKECLVIVDELHQVIDQRAVQNLFGALFKEPRKYRFRFLFSVHGWSSFNEAGKAKDKLIRSIQDARPNLVLLKGGDDFFKSMASLLTPYDLNDFTELMNMEYCGIFRIDVAKKTHLFMAKLLEPAEMRLPAYRKISLEESRGLANQFGRPRGEVERKIHGIKEEKLCNKNSQKSLDDEIARITGESAFQKVN